MGEVDRDVDAQVDDEGSGRREFLKKAGKIAFVVPAIQVLSMAPAGAQSNGSVVTTSMPPGSTMPPTSSTSTSSTSTSSTSTSSTTTTTEAPCEEVRYRVKANWNSDLQEMEWTTGVGGNDCITDSGLWDEEAVGRDIGVHLDQFVFDPDSGDLSGVRMWLDRECIVDIAGVKAGQDCNILNIDWDIFIFRDFISPSISHIEMIVVCCEPPE